ncbi:hypothetical protein E8E14_006191 [Neopestalotiopsis sp. 37M]|nr:hypothetical protein E8E14_006191 [Neopestalotiopsis sp. 37M]
MSDELFLEQASCMSSTTSTDDEEPKVTRTPQREFTPEKSKAAIHCGPELISYSIHFSSLCFTIVVLQLSFRGVYWADEDDWEKNRWSLGISQPVMAGLLQFAAKLHEIFILVSISTIVIDIIRRRLLTSFTIPFGFLTIGLSGRFISLLTNGDYSIYKIGRPHLEATDSSSIKSPVVQAECKATGFSRVSDGDNDAISLIFPTNLLAEDTDPSRGPLVPRNSSWGLTFGGIDTNFTWVDRSHLQFEGQMSNASIGAVAAIRSWIGGNAEDGMDFKVMFINCVIDARWTATQISYDPSNSDLVLSNITDASLFNGTTFSNDMRTKYGIGDPIYIKTGWADLLNAPVINNLGTWLPAVESYLENFPGIDETMTSALQDELTSQFAKFLSLTVVDGLSRVATSPDDKMLGATWKSGNDLVTLELDGIRTPYIFDTDGLNAATQAVFKVRRYGWGYGMQTKTAKFAVSILLIHAVIASAYMLFMFIHWSLYTVISRSWKNMDQLFALAVVSSKPPSLTGVSAGVGTWDTWKLDVALREDQESHEHLELVFGGRDGEPVGREDGKIIWRKKYN